MTPTGGSRRPKQRGQQTLLEEVNIFSNSCSRSSFVLQLLSVQTGLTLDPLFFFLRLTFVRKFETISGSHSRQKYFLPPLPLFTLLVRRVFTQQEQIDQESPFSSTCYYTSLERIDAAPSPFLFFSFVSDV